MTHALMGVLNTAGINRKLVDGYFGEVLGLAFMGSSRGISPTLEDGISIYEYPNS